VTCHRFCPRRLDAALFGEFNVQRSRQVATD
jgi:hypothetical protein